jgi:hypothetical protein
MAAQGGKPYAEPVSLTDVDSYVYETIATLEYTGSPVTRTQIAVTADLDDRTIDASLTALTDLGMLSRTGDGAEATFAPAQRGWSVAPEQARGMDQGRGAR